MKAVWERIGVVSNVPNVVTPGAEAVRAHYLVPAQVQTKFSKQERKLRKQGIDINEVAPSPNAVAQGESLREQTV